MSPHTRYVSSYDCICVLILLYMCPHTWVYRVPGSVEALSEAADFVAWISSDSDNSPPRITKICDELVCVCVCVFVRGWVGGWVGGGGGL